MPFLWLMSVRWIYDNKRKLTPLIPDKPPKLIIGVMMRKLVHVAFGGLNPEKAFDPALKDA